jgi:hypothetical protein
MQLIEDIIPHYLLPAASLRSDWHRHNLKRKMRSLGAIPEEEFQALSDAERRAFDDYNKETL